MSRRNIRTVNGAKHNPHVDHRYARVQNRAAAVIDASEEFGIGFPIDLVAHLHKISEKQLKQDIYGDPIDIQKQYGKKSTLKLERVLQQCLEEIDGGENCALVAVANRIPFVLLRSLEKTRQVHETAKKFLKEMREKLLNDNEKENAENQTKSNQVSLSTINYCR